MFHKKKKTPVTPVTPVLSSVALIPSESVLMPYDEIDKFYYFLPVH
jgi:hypothetical protein